MTVRFDPTLRLPPDASSVADARSSARARVASYRCGGGPDTGVRSQVLMFPELNKARGIPLVAREREPDETSPSRRQHRMGAPSRHRSRQGERRRRVPLPAGPAPPLLRRKGAMGEKVRIPFVFVVEHVTWRPAGEAAPAEPNNHIPSPHSATLPIEASLHPDPALDRLIERARRE